MLEQGNSRINGPHQGALVYTPDNEWWFFHFQSADPLGRVVHLQPVWWQDGWPSIDIDTDGDEVGEPVIGLYSYNTLADEGEAHFNWFRYRFDGPGLQSKE